MVLQRRAVLGNLAVAAAYAALGVATLALGETGGIELRRVIWVSSGLALTAGLLLPFPVWPGVVIGGALTSLLDGSPLLVIAGTGIANGLEVGLTVWVLKRLRFDTALERVPDILALLVMGSGVAAALGAVISVSSLWLAGALAPGSAARLLVMWWITHAMGMLVLTPAGLTLFRGPTTFMRRSAAEHIGVLAAIAVAAWIPFSSLGPPIATEVYFLSIPFLLWAAIRLGPGGSAVAGLIVSSGALYGAVRHLGPFAGGTSNEVLVLTWLFSNVAVISPLIFAALVATTERAEAEQRRLQAQLLQRQKLDSLGVLAGGIAHDFNNLLTSIRGTAELIMASGASTPRVREDAATILRTADQAAGLCRQMLNYAGQPRIAVSSVDLAAELRGIQDLLGVAISPLVDLGIELPNAPLWVTADLTQMRQVVINLLVNAAEAVDATGRRGSVTLRVGRAQLDRSWSARAVTGRDMALGASCLLEVEDTGQGMDEETIRRIFDPFFSSRGASRGLGLSSVLGIIRRHQGVLVVESTPGHGSRFAVALPLIDAPGMSETNDTTSDERPALAGHTILVVDDDATVRSVVVRMLELHGLLVRQAPDGDTALRALAGEPGREIDLVLLDLTMPRKSGIETLTEMRQLGYDHPVIIASGYSKAAVPAEAQVAAFVQKPFQAQDLVKEISKVLRTADVAVR